MPTEKRMIMSTVSGIDGVCNVCGTDQQAFAETLSQPTCNYDVDCRTSEDDWFCLACGYGWERTIFESKNGQLWKETFYFPMDDDGFVNRPGDPTKTMAQRKAEHRAKCAVYCAAQSAVERMNYTQPLMPATQRLLDDSKTDVNIGLILAYLPWQSPNMMQTS